MSFSQVWFAQVEIIPGPAAFFKPIDLFPGREIKGFFIIFRGECYLANLKPERGKSLSAAVFSVISLGCVCCILVGEGETEWRMRCFISFFGRSTISFLSVKRVWRTRWEELSVEWGGKFFSLFFSRPNWMENWDWWKSIDWNDSRSYSLLKFHVIFFEESKPKTFKINSFITNRTLIRARLSPPSDPKS